jgi:hypothetical protein
MIQRPAVAIITETAALNDIFSFKKSGASRATNIGAV